MFEHYNHAIEDIREQTMLVTTPTLQELRELCQRLVTCTDDEQARDIGEKLRTALHNHMAELRSRLSFRSELPK